MVVIKRNKTENTDSIEEKIDVLNGKSSLFEDLTKDEIAFLQLFIDGERIISEEKVAKIL